MRAEAPRMIRDFNPRSPCGERRFDLALALADLGISIHAPRAGSDDGLIDKRGKWRISIHAPRAGSDRPG